MPTATDQCIALRGQLKRIDGSSSHAANTPITTRFLAANLASAPELNHSTLAVLGLAGRALASGCRSHGGGGSGGGATERHSALARSSRLADADPHCTGSGGSAGSCGSNGLGRTQEQHGHGHSSGGGRAVGWRLVTVPESATALDALR